MADDQETSNDMGDENPADDYGDADGNDINDGNDPIAPITTTEIPPPTPPPYEPYNNDDGGNNVQNDYDDDEPLPDVTVKLFINGDGSDTDNINGLVTDIVDGRITDEIGKFGPTTTPSLQEGIESYTSAITQGIFDEVNANGTDVGGKRWWGSWSWHKILIVILIALCIIGIILALLCCLRRRRKPQNNAPGGKRSGTGEQERPLNPRPENV